MKMYTIISHVLLMKSLTWYIKNHLSWTLLNHHLSDHEFPFINHWLNSIIKGMIGFSSGWSQCKSPRFATGMAGKSARWMACQLGLPKRDPSGSKKFHHFMGLTTPGDMILWHVMVLWVDLHIPMICLGLALTCIGISTHKTIGTYLHRMKSTTTSGRNITFG